VLWACAAALLQPLDTQAADRFPTRNISFIIPDGPGGGADLLVRLLASALDRLVPVNVVPINVDAGGGGKAMLELWQARPSGYTIAEINVPGIFVLEAVRGLKQDLSKFTWLASITRGEPYALAVGYDSPIRSVADLQALSRIRRVTFSSTGPEGTGYLATLVAARLLGIRCRPITGYSGSTDSVVGAIRGDVDAVIAAQSTLHRLEKGNFIRLLAIFTDERTPPGVENALGLGRPELSQVMAIRMLGGPPGMPRDRADVLGDLLGKALRTPAIAQWARNIGEVLDPRGPVEATRVVSEQRAFFERWKRLLALS
jgi:tripartite-type tricarboxylate transporter receptor subunit TctC